MVDPTISVTERSLWNWQSFEKILVNQPIIKKPLIVRVVLYKIDVLRRGVAETVGRLAVVAVAVRVRAVDGAPDSKTAFVHRLAWNREVVV